MCIVKHSSVPVGAVWLQLTQKDTVTLHITAKWEQPENKPDNIFLHLDWHRLFRKPGWDRHDCIGSALHFLLNYFSWTSNRLQRGEACRCSTKGPHKLFPTGPDVKSWNNVQQMIIPTARIPGERVFGQALTGQMTPHCNLRTCQVQCLQAITYLNNYPWTSVYSHGVWYGSTRIRNERELFLLHWDVTIPRTWPQILG